jgi:prepilin-type N-terminal cleavage/methylation domain-containing protein
MKPPSLHRSGGFTLIEIMVALGLLSAILAGALSAMISFSASTQSNVQTADMQDNARRALEILEADLRSAGVGSSNGTVGISPKGVWTARIPTIYTGVTSSSTISGNTFFPTSLYIIGAEPSSLGPNGVGDGMMAVITSSTGAQIVCSTPAGVQVDCQAARIGSDNVDHRLLLPNPATAACCAPLLVHDHQRASLISPNANASGLAAPSPQNVPFDESPGPISPDPSAPFGFAQGFQVSRARVVHWYLKQRAGETMPRLYRSHPVLADAAGTCANPFLDETNGGTVVGTEIANGPIESLQVRFMFDTSQQDNPVNYDMVATIDPCDSNAPTRMRQLREVRLQMVAISPTMAKDSNGANTVSRFAAPQFEGTSVGPGSSDPKVSAKYPRRAYVSRVAPRNIQPYRL